MGSIFQMDGATTEKVRQAMSVLVLSKTNIEATDACSIHGSAAVSE